MLAKLSVFTTFICLISISAKAQPCTTPIANNSFTIAPATCVGTAGTLKGSAPTGGNGIYTYQWQASQGNCGQNMFQDIAGATNIDYAIPTSAGTNDCYRRVVRSGNCPASNTPTMRFDASDVTTPQSPVVSVIQPILSLPTGTITVTTPAPGAGISYSINGSTYSNTSGIFALLAPGTYSVTARYPAGCVSPARSVSLAAPAALAVSIAPASATVCAGASVTLTATGNGNSYQWQLNGTAITGATGTTYVATQTGKYTVTATAGTNNVTSNESVVTVRAPITFNANTANTSCGSSNGSITVSSTAGGSGSGYTYSINNGTSFQSSNSFTGLAGGSYEVVVKDAAGCVSTASTATVQASTGLSATVSTINFSCTASPGSATIAATGGITPYTYSINSGTPQSSNTFQNLSAGNYALQVKDAGGCTYATTFTIAQASALSAPTATVVQPTATQTTGSITVTSPAPAPGISYSIDGTNYSNTSGNFTGLAPGNYSVTAKYPTGCISPARTVNIAVPTPTASSITPASAQICPGSSVTLTINGTGTSYQWFLNGTAITGAIGSTYAAQQAGNYTANVINGTITTPASNTVAVTVSPAITFTYGIKNASCGTATGEISILSATGGSGGGYNYSINNGTTFQASNVFPGLSAGSYQVVVRDAAGCRSNPILVTLQGSSSLSATVNTTNVSCNQSPGSATVIAAGGTSPYTYSLNNGTPQSSNSFPNLAAGTYNVAVKDAAGCTFTATFTIEQSAALTAPTVVSIQPTCILNTGTITVTSPAPGAGVTYSIDGLTYNNIAGVFTGLAAGSYNVTAKYPNGCISPSTPVTLTAALTPSGSISPATANICFGNGQVLTISGGTSYQWFKNGTAISGATSSTYTATESGVYTATINNGLCSGQSSNSATVIVNTVPSGTISPSTANICSGETTTLTANGGIAYQWYRNDNPIIGAATATYNATQSGTYTVDIVNEQGCRAKATNSAVVNVTSQPTGTITPSSAHLCPGASATLSASGSSAYQWYLNGTAISGATSSTYIAQQAGTYTVRLGSGNCAAFATNSVVVTASTTINFSVSTTNADCITPTGSLTISGISGGSGGYSYSINNGASFQAGTTFSNLPAGSYQVVVKDAAGCASTPKPGNIQTIASTLSASVNTTNIACGQTTGSATVTATGGTVPYTYAITNGTPQSSNSFTNLAAGTYNVAVKDAVGCTFSVTFNVTPVTSNLTATATVTDALCGAPAGAVTIAATSGSAPYTYSLDNGAFQAAASFSNVGVGPHRVVVKDNAGCTFTLNFDVKRFGDAPNLIITNPPVICIGATTNLRAATITTGSDTGLTYTYWLDTTATTPVVNPGAATVGKYFIKATNGTGCTSIKAVTVPAYVGTPGLITSTDPLTACLGSPVTLSASAGRAYQWYLNDTIIPGARAATYSAAIAGVYSVTIADTLCPVFAANKMTVQFRDCSALPGVEAFVPTGFTPNKNGKNDVLRPLFNGTVTLKYFKVFNRWGQQVFQTNKVNEGWNGTIKGSPQPSETYTWILEYIDNNGDIIKKSGRTLLIR
ncbi:MAG: T9SS type B sorting domain-containing protein [Sphingobacteriales bacterium]|nr:MAG: T9SS type B sorting domain-containing protein [Sphingobacteriales bacterium]